MLSTKLSCDVLVVGGGAAGCRAAREAKKAIPGLDVLLAVPGRFGVEGSTNIVASEALGINAPLNLMQDDDSADAYYADTVATGAGLSDPHLCRILADESAERITELRELGLRFAGKGDAVIQQKLSGCTHARSLTCGGTTGVEIVNALKRDMDKRGVRIREEITLERLLRDANGAVVGARGTYGGAPVEVTARAVVLATGGAGNAFSRNVVSGTQNGDGWAMAYDAGCRFVNMEFFQIGPAVVYPKIRFIIHSHMWRLEPEMRNGDGRKFLGWYCKGVDTGEALRLKAMSYPFSVRTDAKYIDIAIFQEVMQGRGTPSGGVLFDVTHVTRDVLTQKAPITYHTIRKAGVDLAEQPIEVGMAVQNFNGGILIDENGFTGVEGLYAAGEITGGVHGADRPGGNNLTDTQVFGYRAGVAAAQYAAGKSAGSGRPTDVPGVANDGEDAGEIARWRRTFYEKLTVVRCGEALRTLRAELAERMQKPASARLTNLLTVGNLISTACLARQESRGTHYRQDYPHTDGSWQTRIVLQKDAQGKLTAARQDTW